MFRHLESRPAKLRGRARADRIGRREVRRVPGTGRLRSLKCLWIRLERLNSPRTPPQWLRSTDEVERSLLAKDLPATAYGVE